MKLITTISFAALASAVVVNFNKRDSPLKVNIEAVGNSGIRATITNPGATDLKIFKTGSILDNLAIEKADVFNGDDDEKVAFDGIRLRLQTSGLPEEAFETIAAGQTITTEWDVAQAHDLSKGGKFKIAAKGSLSFAQAGSTDIAGAASFSSNVLDIDVDGPTAAKTRQDFKKHVKRTIVQPGCNSAQLSAITQAFANSYSLSGKALTAALSGPAAKMEEYFKSSTTATRNTVANVFYNIANECRSTTTGVARQYCTDVLSSCYPGVIAYTVPSQSYIVSCPTFFTMTALSSACHAQDQATTQIHEATHLLQIKGTTDQSGCYGYACIRSLTADQNLNHADTYAEFANAIYAGC